jgi:hypothetical protein
MTKLRVSTTVDADLLAQARALDPGATDASMIELALQALLHRHRRAEIDRSYASAFSAHPFDEPDEWGDLATFADAMRLT